MLKLHELEYPQNNKITKLIHIFTIPYIFPIVNRNSVKIAFLAQGGRARISAKQKNYYYGFCIRERVYKGNGGVFIKSKQALKMCTLCMITMIDGTFHSQFKLNKKIGQMVILCSLFQ